MVHEVSSHCFEGPSHKHYTSANEALRGSEADRIPDYLLAPADAIVEDGEHDWSSNLVIRGHKKNLKENCSVATLLKLAGYEREVFGSQADRRFMHGFMICESVMRLWMFLSDLAHTPPRNLTPTKSLSSSLKLSPATP